MRKCPTDSDMVIAALRRGVPVRVLIIGDDSAVARVLAQVQMHCGQPVYDCRSGGGPGTSRRSRDCDPA